jgi:serine/threonine protein kinase
MQHEPTANDDTDFDALSPGMSLLRGQYVIERYLVRGGFGITYLARDSLDRRVVIKECFPGVICRRTGDRVQARSGDLAAQYASILRHFLREARRLAKLTHANIVGVHQVFEENGTAYMALDLVEGEDLLGLIEETPHRLTPQLVRDMLKSALHAIDYIHGQGILHRDISPDNFLLGPGGHLTLIDFGAAREQAGRESRALSAMLAVKDGYSPHEFYLADVTQYPSSDLYSLGATFHHLITGEAPPHSQDRLAAIAAEGDDPYQNLVGRVEGYDPAFLSAIDTALAVLPRERMQTAAVWLAALDGRRAEALVAATPVVAPVAAPVVGPSNAPVPQSLAPELRHQISRLVEDTNRTLTRASSDAAQTMAANIRFSPQIEEPARLGPSRPVDIFGNPIEDVDAWLRDQDQKNHARMNADRMGDDNAAHKGDHSRPRVGFLARRFSPFRFSRGQAVQN